MSIESELAEYSTTLRALLVDKDNAASEIRLLKEVIKYFERKDEHAQDVDVLRGEIAAVDAKYAKLESKLDSLSVLITNFATGVAQWHAERM